MNCKICGNNSAPIFTKKVLAKYDVTYYKCNTCCFIQTEEPYWLNESYSNAINASDIGLISRNVVFSEIVTSLFKVCKFNTTAKYLDYGGGYGMFVRLMRNNGFNFYWSDEYCENLYATKFKAIDLPVNERKFEVLTAFEVFEHLANPVEDIKKMLTFSDSLLFSTELHSNDIDKIKDWWYVGAEHGQHIAFYHIKTLEKICEKEGLNLYSHKSLHLLTKKKINSKLFKLSTTYQLARIINTLFMPKSLIQADFELYKK